MAHYRLSDANTFPILGRLCRSNLVSSIEFDDRSDTAVGVGEASRSRSVSERREASPLENRHHKVVSSKLEDAIFEWVQ
jgi:hypothetical protein